MKRRLSVLALLIAGLVTTASTPPASPASYAGRMDYCYESGCRIVCCDSRGFCIYLEDNCAR